MLSVLGENLDQTETAQWQDIYRRLLHCVVLQCQQVTGPDQDAMLKLADETTITDPLIAARYYVLLGEMLSAKIYFMLAIEVHKARADEIKIISAFYLSEDAMRSL